MGQSQARLRDPEMEAQCACGLDPDRNNDDDEEALIWAHKGMQAVLKSPLAMARANVVDMTRGVEEEDATALMKVLGSRDQVYFHKLGNVECDGFVERFLPGVVERDSWDGTPVNGYFHATERRGDGEVPYVELARAHPGDDPASRQGTEGTSAAGFDTKRFAPLTTKAGSRIWSLYFAAPEKDVVAMHASYPCQMLIRYAPSTNQLCYDVFDMKPMLKPAFKAHYDRAVTAAEAGDVALLDSVATVPELNECAVLCQKSRNQRRDMHNIALGTGFGGDNEEDEPQQRDDLLAGAPRGSSQLDRIQAYGPSVLWVLLHHIRWKKSWCRRLRFDLDALKDAKVYPVEKLERPNKEMLEPTNRSGLTVDDLGRPEDEEDRVATGLIAGDATLERTAVLILEFKRLAPSFAATQILPASIRKKVRVPCDDWTPGKVGSRATRHYIVGDESELREHTNYLASKDAAFNKFMSRERFDVWKNLTSIATYWDPLKAPVPEPPKEEIGGVKMPADVLGHIEAFAKKKKITKKDVNAYLASAGVENPKKVNRCLKAAMLNGALDSWHRIKPTAFLDTVLLEKKCPCCGDEVIRCTVRDMLVQEEVGHDYEEGSEGGAQYCDECETGIYITGLCLGTPRFDTGKGANHCVICPDWGQCIGDVRNAHCGRCGDHYFAGFSGYRCPCRGTAPGGGARRFDDEYDSDEYDDYGIDDDEYEFEGIIGGDDDDEEEEEEEPSSVAALTPPPTTAESWNAKLVGIPEMERADLLERAEDLLRPDGAVLQAKNLLEKIQATLPPRLLESFPAGLMERFVFSPRDTLPGLELPDLRAQVRRLIDCETAANDAIREFPMAALDADDDDDDAEEEEDDDEEEMEDA